jgi:anti-sigma factor RsiW
MTSSLTPETRARVEDLLARCRRDADRIREVRSLIAMNKGPETSTAEERAIENLAELIEILFGDS